VMTVSHRPGLPFIERSSGSGLDIRTAANNTAPAGRAAMDSRGRRA
jgi:hypothetical protein